MIDINEVSSKQLEELAKQKKAQERDLQAQKRARLIQAQQEEKEKKAQARQEEKEKKAQEREQQRQERAENKKAQAEEKQELDIDEKYRVFMGALSVYNSTEMNFFIDKNPQYFRKLTTQKTNAKTSKQEITTELVYNTHASLYPCWVELEHPYARKMFRHMIDGREISIQNPETEQWETYQFGRRVYEKLVNTVDQVDDKTFNVLDLSQIMQPETSTEQIECPIIMQALLYAISGNTIRWDDVNHKWLCDKPENLEYMEKWTYGVVHADIGNNMLPMPVIFGPGKVGKNAYFEIILSTILGAELVFSGTWDTIDSGFNAFKLGKVFVFVDEIPERGEWNKVKNATGSLKEYIKTKYGAEFQVDNCIAYAMGSNQPLFPLPFEDGKQMIRVSPIRVVATSTFAENAYRMLNQARGENYCRNLLRDNGIAVDRMSDFEVGDSLLKRVLAPEWQGRECAQQFLNYLHQKYQSERYNLQPLRGQDWDEISEYKKDAVKNTAEFVILHNPIIISTHEIYEIYRVIQGDRNASMSKQIAAVTENIKPYMEAAGWQYLKDAVIHGGARTNVFRRPDPSPIKLSEYKEKFDRYIDDSTNGRSMRRLRGVVDVNNHNPLDRSGLF